MTKERVISTESEEPVVESTSEAKARVELIPGLSAANPEERIAAVEAEKAEIHDRMLRIAADFDNWKKRARKDQADGEARAKESVLRDLLEIVDGLERATVLWTGGKEVDSTSVRAGVELVLRQFLLKLAHYQVKPMQAEGLPFDPRIHEAVSQVPSAAATPGSIVRELQKGVLALSLLPVRRGT